MAIKVDEGKLHGKYQKLRYIKHEDFYFWLWTCKLSFKSSLFKFFFKSIWKNVLRFIQNIFSFELYQFTDVFSTLIYKQ